MSDINDTTILEATKVNTDDKGRIQYETTLPSGRKLTSEYMDPDKAKGSVIVSWCEHVRSQAGADEAEARAIKDRGDLDLEDDPAITSTVDNVSDEPEPLEYAKSRRDAYKQRLDVLETRITDLKTERTVTRGHYEQWTKVVDTLRGETDE